jgi:DNA-directed RNA polymerase subunit L
MDVDMQGEDAEQYAGTTFAVDNEDHTLANSLRFFLNKK